MNSNSKIKGKTLNSGRVNPDQLIYKQLIEKNSGSIYVVQDGKIVFHNPHFCLLTGYTSREIKQMDFIDLVHPKDKKLIKLLFSNNFREISIKKSSSFTFRANHKSGEMRWFKSNVSIIPLNGKPALLDNCFDITHQKQFEEKLVEEEKNFRLLVNAFEDMIFIISKGDTVIQANKSVYQMLGYAEHQVMLKSFSGFHLSNERESVKAKLREAFQGNRVLFNVHIQSNDGKNIPVETRLFCGNWSQKEVVFAICQDITVRLEAERIIKLSEEKFSKAFENNSVMMTISTFDEGKYLDVNDTFLKVTGLNRDEVIGKTSAELNIFPEIHLRQKLKKHVVSKGKVKDVETIMLNRKGQNVICQFSAELIDIQGSPCLLAVMNDITQRKQAEERIRLSEQRFRQLAELLPGMLFEANSKGTITFANNYLISTYGFPPSRLKKKLSICSLFDRKSCNTIKTFIENSKTNHELPSVELTAQKQNKELFPALTHIVAIIENSQVSRYMGIMVDITARKQQEIELIRAKKEAEEASKAKERFLSTMSHEIRTPMNAIIGIANILQQEDPKESQLSNIHTLKYSAENLMALLNDILDFSKIEAGKLKINKNPIELKLLAEGLYNTFKHITSKKGLDFSFQIDPQIPNTLLGDSVRINQVLINLTSNAIKFTDKGRITLKIELKKELKAGFQILFSLSDTGIGIPVDKQKLIFKEFTQASVDTTRKYGGTGLGLAISQRLVELLGGKLGIRSKPGKGSEFYFTLNLAKSKAVKDRTDKLETETIVFVKPYRILVVEDNEINSMIVLKFLNSWGLQSELAENGELALELVKNETFDLILMDLEMPVMNGYEAASQIRKLKDPVKNSIPIIALSASAMLDVQNKIFSIGMNEFVLKPFNPSNLKRKIANILNPV